MDRPSTDSSIQVRRAPGARVHDAGVSYCVWAPDHPRLSVKICDAGGTTRELALEREEGGYFTATDPWGRAGDRYRFILSDRSTAPDPASRFQPDGVHGWSECIDSRRYCWRTKWERPMWRGQSIYELHVGTFTPEGFGSGPSSLRPP